MESARSYRHPRLTRRHALQAGSVGLLGLGMNHLPALQAMAAPGTKSKAKSVIYIFLSGGLSQHESFDPKPEAPDTVRGEFTPIATRTPGLAICEHLPMLAERSHLWSVVRSMTHPHNEHSDGHLVMMSGRSKLPPVFSRSKPQSGDWPAMASIVGDAARQYGMAPNNLPPAVVLPEILIHRTGRTIPGQFAGQMGPHRDPWFIKASPYNASSYGAFPEYGFHHERGAENPKDYVFQAPHLALPEGLGKSRMSGRFDLLSSIEQQRRDLEQTAAIENFDRHRQQAVSLLADPATQQAFDVAGADPKLREKYGENLFGWSLLMARQLVEVGVNMVQVNLGNNESWDNHQSLFPNLKNFLLPPTDRAVSALLDDLHERGLLENTLVVMAGEFGRTPRLSKLSGTRLPGRDHWGAVQSVLFAGGGLAGGRVIGSSDRLGGYPHTSPHTPEEMAATIYHSLGIPDTAAWIDDVDRPHHIYHGEPIRGLLA